MCSRLFHDAEAALTNVPQLPRRAQADVIHAVQENSDRSRPEMKMKMKNALGFCSARQASRIFVCQILLVSLLLSNFCAIQQKLEAPLCPRLGQDTLPLGSLREPKQDASNSWSFNA